MQMDTLNQLDESEFVKTAGGLVENAKWVVQLAASKRPFASIDEMCAAIEEVIRSISEEALTDLLNGHPELSGMEAQEGTMTDESTNEQGRLGLLSLEKEQFSKLTSLNQAYSQRFGFPFIIALRLQPDLDAVFAEFGRRLCNSREIEIENAIIEIMQVVRGRASNLGNYSALDRTQSSSNE